MEWSEEGGSKKWRGDLGRGGGPVGERMRRWTGRDMECGGKWYTMKKREQTDE